MLRNQHCLSTLLDDEWSYSRHNENAKGANGNNAKNGENAENAKYITAYVND